MHPSEPAQLAELFRDQRKAIWALGYRLTGSAADADDIVQETFTRAMEQAPDDRGEGVRPWLARVATNLGIDTLRKRKRRAYTGAWLPSPIETSDELDTSPDDHEAGPEARYGFLESVSFAFLLALEALGPRQRAVLVLCDVLDYSAREAGAAIGTTEANARVLHHRARQTMRDYDRDRRIPTRALQDETRRVLEQFMACLARQDLRGVEALLADSVRTVTDAGGRYTALRTPLVGRSKVAHFYLRAAQHRQAAGPLLEMRMVNGLPAMTIVLSHPQRKQGPRTVMRCDLDRDGRIREVHSILAPDKLSAIAF
jgi:RNA polymerase sigma-70 factor (ECF subfamily)